MARKAAGKFRCKKCGKTFGMAMHLGRHMSTAHGESKASPAVSKTPRRARNADIGNLAGGLASMIGQLQAERQEHANAIAEIDGIFERFGIQPQERRGPGRPPGKAGRKLRHKPGMPSAAEAGKPMAAGGRRRRGKRGTFAKPAHQSILDFLKGQGTEGATTAEINKHWQAEGRAGSAYITIGKLVQDKKLKKEDLKGQRGSRYRVV